MWSKIWNTWKGLGQSQTFVNYLEVAEHQAPFDPNASPGMDVLELPKTEGSPEFSDCLCLQASLQTLAVENGQLGWTLGVGHGSLEPEVRLHWGVPVPVYHSQFPLIFLWTSQVFGVLDTLSVEDIPDSPKFRTRLILSVRAPPSEIWEYSFISLQGSDVKVLQRFLQVNHLIYEVVPYAAGQGGLTTCIICLDHECDTLILPCRHLCLCSSCAGQGSPLFQCPLCRSVIQVYLQLYNAD